MKRLRLTRGSSGPQSVPSCRTAGKSCYEEAARRPLSRRVVRRPGDHVRSVARDLPAAVVITSVVIFQGAANADHLPDDLLATGKPETTLAGINLVSTKLADVLRMYGPPARQTTVPNNPSWTGYIWNLPNAKLELGVDRDGSAVQITDIYVEGSDKGKVGSTGRGIHLGEHIEDLKRIYGDRLMVQAVHADPSKPRMEFSGVTAAQRRAVFQWKSEEFTLTAGLDSDDRIIALWLILPECYPGGCE